MQHTIQANEKPIVDIFCDKYVFSIPSYQRPYAWTTEQAGELLDDIVAAIDGDGPIQQMSPYFLGSIVLIKDPQETEAWVVDGQQRLTTLTILLSVLRDLAEPTIARSIHSYICQTGDAIRDTTDVFRLTPRDRDAKFFRQRIQAEGSTRRLLSVEGLPDAQRRMIENAQFLRDRLSSEFIAAKRQQLATYISLRCFLVIVAASDQDSAFRIFSVLNSRGLDLSPTDILKADVIGKLPTEALQDQYNKTWEDTEEQLGRVRFANLFAHIRMIHRHQKMKGTMVAEFRSFVPTIQQPIKFIENELGPYADAYEEITDHHFSSHARADEINRKFKHLSRLDNDDWQAPAIVMTAKHRDTPDLLFRFLGDLDRLAYGLFFLRAGPSERIRRYGRLLGAIQNSEDLFTESSPLQLTADEQAKVVGSFNEDIYSVIRVRLPLLLRLDEHLSDGSATYDFKTISVEHVLPQNPDSASQWATDFPRKSDRDRWVHKLANLVLLTRKKNSQAGNQDFEEKKKRYFAPRKGVANFAITSQVLAAKAWTPDTLDRRQAQLVGALKKLWRLNA